jgi:5-formyltetrahydrofolate cyclo-ligase
MLAKTALRDQLATTRSRRGLAAGAEDARALAEVLMGLPEIRRAATVAAYVSIPGEPGTGPFLDAFTALGRRVLLPIVDGRTLDWAAYEGPDSLVRARFGLLEPVGRRLGADAIATADVVLAPAMAVDRTGMRLGKGGGYYDRALGRVPVGTFVAALLFDGEILDEVPSEPHDRRVTAAVTPRGVTRFA